MTDETGRNSGTIYGLPIVGNDNAWNEGKFGNALLLDGQDGYVNFGPLQLDGSFSFSFWVKPDLNSTEDGTGALLSKFGISTMNHFQISKEDGNGSVKVDYYPDGLSTPVSYSSGTNILENGTWSFLTLVYDADSTTLSFHANGALIFSEENCSESNNSLPYGFRFSNLVMGSGSSSFKGMVDDLRYYSSALNSGEIDQIYNSGGGDYQTFKLLVLVPPELPPAKMVVKILKKQFLSSII